MEAVWKCHDLLTKRKSDGCTSRVNRKFTVNSDRILTFILLDFFQDYQMPETDRLLDKLGKHCHSCWSFRRLNLFQNYLQRASEKVLITILCAGKPTEEIIDWMNRIPTIERIFIYGSLQKIDCSDYFQISSKIQGISSSLETSPNNYWVELKISCWCWTMELGMWEIYWGAFHTCGWFWRFRLMPPPKGERCLIYWWVGFVHR